MTSPHAAADVCRTLALWLDSGQLTAPDEAPRTFTAENVDGWDLLVEAHPDGAVILKHRDHNVLWPGQWSKGIELVQAEIGAAS